MPRLPLFAVLFVASLAACNNKPSEPEASPVPHPASTGDTPKPSHTARPAGPTDVAYDAPPSWTAGKASPMRKATYVVPRAPGDAEDGELSVSQAGGSVDQNVARWAQQLDKKPTDAKRTERMVNGLKVTVVEIHGDYSGMAMPGAQPADKPAKKPGYAMLGAIVETTPPTFFKLTGPDKTVANAQHDFDKMVDGMRAK